MKRDVTAFIDADNVAAFSKVADAAVRAFRNSMTKVIRSIVLGLSPDIRMLDITEYIRNADDRPCQYETPKDEPCNFELDILSVDKDGGLSVIGQSIDDDGEWTFDIDDIGLNELGCLYRAVCDVARRVVDPDDSLQVDTDGTVFEDED